ncbi:MAG: preprotein translocase subunit YajC [Bombilactobacillus mellifer]|nr:preprotein translocase subunit YajC [Bombilactobacillus mellifer]
MIVNLMAQQGNAGANMVQMILLFVVFFGAMYFISIRPQKKRMAAQQEKLSKVKKGDSVIIRSGLHGKVDSVNQEKRIFVLDANGILLTFELGAILQIVSENKNVSSEHLNTKDDTDTAETQEVKNTSSETKKNKEEASISTSSNADKNEDTPKIDQQNQEK